MGLLAFCVLIALVIGVGGACFFSVCCFLVKDQVDSSESSKGVLDGILLTPIIEMGGEGGLL